jgi:hypothetical protein
VPRHGSERPAPDVEDTCHNPQENPKLLLTVTLQINARECYIAEGAYRSVAIPLKPEKVSSVFCGLKDYSPAELVQFLACYII